MKNKLIQNSKGILSRGFNSLKCKTSLRMSVSRLKILRNKKEVQITQMEKEIAQLLESGQGPTARMRVEHLVREQKMRAAYDLLEIYCELIFSRLSMIESQKNVPIDLKEALASVIFASPRCGDIPELVDARRHLTTKYGKDFATSAVELRPESGVSRMLVEKLSTTPPDGATKINILISIAKDHNIKWDPISLEEKDLAASNDLATGRNNFGSSSSQHVKPPIVESPVVHSSSSNKMDNPSLNFSQQHSSNNNMYSSSSNVPQKDPRTSPATENLSSAQNYGVSTFQPPLQPSGDKRTQLFQDDSFRSSLDKHNWNMKFEDAASAAQAAAESAELASFAARAAAELSNRDKIMRQNSTESRNSDENVSKDKRRDTYETSKLAGTDNSFQKSTFEETRLQKEEKYKVKPDNEKKSGSFKESGGESKKYRESSLNSKASEDYESMDHDVPAVTVKSQKNSSKVPIGNSSMKKQSFVHDVYETDDQPQRFKEFTEDRVEKPPSFRSSSADAEEHVRSNSVKSDASKDPELKNYGFNSINESPKKSSEVCTSEEEVESSDDWPQKPKDYREEGTGRQQSVKFSQRYSNISDDVNIFAHSVDQIFDHDADENTAIVTVRGSFKEEVLQTRYDEPDDPVYDKSDLYSENHGIYSGFVDDEKDSASHYPSKSFGHLSIETDSSSSRSNSRKTMKPSSPTLFSDRKNSLSGLPENLSKDASELNESAPPKFDDSEGPSSESDNDSRSRHNFDGLSSESEEEIITPENFVMDGSKNLPNRRSNHGESSRPNEELETGIKQLSRFSDDELKSNKMLKDVKKHGKSKSPEKFRLGKLTSPPSSGPDEFEVESAFSETKFSSEIGEGLNFGKLTGGLRHKGYNRPPYMKNKVGGSSSRKETEKITTSSIGSTSPPDIESPKNSQKLILGTTKTPLVHSDTDSDSSEEEEFPRKKTDRTQGRIIPDTGKRVKNRADLKGRNSFFDSDHSDLEEYAPKESDTKKIQPQSGVSRRTKLTYSSNKKSSTKELEETEMPKVSETLIESEAQGKKPMKWGNYERPTPDKAASKPSKPIFWVPPETLISEKETDEKVLQSKSKLNSGSLDLEPSYGRKPVNKPHKESGKLPAETEEENPNPLTFHSYESPRKNNKKAGSYEHKESFSPAKSSTRAAPEDPKATSKLNQLSPLKTSAPSDKEKASTIGANKDKATHMSTASEQSSKMGASVSSDSPRAPVTNNNNNEPPRKATHVHPKLPDYDSLVSALRKNRT